MLKIKRSQGLAIKYQQLILFDSNQKNYYSMINRIG